MFNFDYIKKEDIKENNQISQKFLTIQKNINSWRFWIWKNKKLLNLISKEPNIDKIYLYAKDPYEAKYQFLSNKGKSAVLKYLNASNPFIEYWNDMDDIYKDIQEYNPNKKRKILIVFDNMIAYMIINKNLVQ